MKMRARPLFLLLIAVFFICSQNAIAQNSIEEVINDIKLPHVSLGTLKPARGGHFKSGQVS